MRANEENTAWTMETLQEYTNHSHGAVLRYGDYILVSDLIWTKKDGQVNDARIYQLAEQPVPGILSTSRSFIECRLEEVAKAKTNFQDPGHAIAWCLAQI